MNGPKGGAATKTSHHKQPCRSFRASLCPGPEPMQYAPTKKGRAAIGPDGVSRAQRAVAATNARRPRQLRVPRESTGSGSSQCSRCHAPGQEGRPCASSSSSGHGHVSVTQVVGARLLRAQCRCNASGPAENLRKGAGRVLCLLCGKGQPVAPALGAQALRAGLALLPQKQCLMKNPGVAPKPKRPPELAGALGVVRSIAVNLPGGQAHLRWPDTPDSSK